MASLHSCRAGGGIAHGIIDAAASASALKDYLVCAVNPICRGDYTAEDCQQLARFVVFADSHLKQGNRVVVHCRQGQHRTGVAIYLLLRLIVGAPEECLSMMEKMRPVMHEELLRITRHRHLYSTAESILADTRFLEGVARRALVERKPVVA